MLNLKKNNNNKRNPKTLITPLLWTFQHFYASNYQSNLPQKNILKFNFK